MSAHEPEMLTPEEQRASAAVRALSAPPADAAFRARLAREGDDGDCR